MKNPVKSAGRQSAKKPQSKKTKAAPAIRFTATLHRPAAPAKADWSFLSLPKEASSKLPSRGMVSVEGAINGSAFQATLEPDGKGGHWLKVDRKLREAITKASAKMGANENACANERGVVTLEITPLSAEQEPEPTLPPDLRKALATAPPKAKDVWSDITPAARRDWIHWIVSPKQAETRARRITNACDMLAKGKRRPCCFDRSGMYDKSLTCPTALKAEDE